MKSRILLFTILSSFLFLAACKKTSTPQNAATVNGTWHMKNVSGGLIGIDLDYDMGDVSWHFNEVSNLLTVTNNIISTGPKDVYAKFDTGTYSYQINTANGISTLFVDNQEIGVFTVSQTSLLLDDGVAADGFLTTFNR